MGLSQAPRRNGEGPKGVNVPLPVKGVTVPEKAVTGRPDAAAAAASWRARTRQPPQRPGVGPAFF